MSDYIADELRKQTKPHNFSSPDERCYTTHVPVYATSGTRTMNSNFEVFAKECAHLDSFVCEIRHWATGRGKELFVHRDQLRIPAELLERLGAVDVLDDETYQQELRDDAMANWEGYGGSDSFLSWVVSKVGAHSADFINVLKTQPQYHVDGQMEDIIFDMEQTFEAYVREHKELGRMVYILKEERWPIEYVPPSTEEGDVALLVKIYKKISSELDDEVTWITQEM